VLDEKGVINVQPATVCVAFAHLATYRFRLRAEKAREAKYQKFSGYVLTLSQNSNFNGKNDLYLYL